MMSSAKHLYYILYIATEKLYARIYQKYKQELSPLMKSLWKSLWFYLEEASSQQLTTSCHSIFEFFHINNVLKIRNLREVKPNVTAVLVMQNYT